MSKIRKRVVALIAVFCLLVLTGCSVLREERIKLQDLGFTIVSEEKLPEELKSIIDEKKQDPFKLTYNDEEFLYIVIGYGQQPSSGYSITVGEFYLSKDAIYVNTTLLGPESTDSAGTVPSTPYIVLKTDYIDKPVVFE